MNALINAGDSPAGPPVEANVSDLTLLCLPEEGDSENRMCAWAATVSGFLLFVGTFGFFRKPLEFVMSVAREPDPVAVVFTPPPQTPKTETPETSEPDKSADPSADVAPSVTVVAATASEVSFAVPVVGNTIVGPARMASAPPINNIAVSRPSAPPAPSLALFTGEENRSDYPYPPYPLEARKRGMSGKCLFIAEVDTTGACKKVEIKESCGHGYLDSYASDWVKRRWVWPAGPVRRYEIPITFSLDRR